MENGTADLSDLFTLMNSPCLFDQIDSRPELTDELIHRLYHSWSASNEDTGNDSDSTMDLTVPTRRADRDKVACVLNGC